MYCIVLPWPAGNHSSTTIRSAGAWLLQGGEAGQLHTRAQPDSRKAHQHSWNSTSRVHVPRGTGQPHKEQDRDMNEEDGVEHTYGMKGCRRETRRPRRRQLAPMRFLNVSRRNQTGRTRSPLAAGRNQTNVKTNAKMKLKEKAEEEEEVEDRDKKKKKKKKKTRGAECLPATDKSGPTGNQTKKPYTA